MIVLRDFAGLLAVSPGSLVYHVVTLFASQVVLGIALVAWRQRRDSPLSVRVLALAGTFALSRVVLVVVAGLDQAGIVWGEAVLPPLERFLDFVTLFVSIWAVLPVLMRYRRIGTALLVAGLALGAGIYILTAFLWLRRVLEGSFYNHYWQSSAWEILSAAILLPTLVVAALSRHEDWGLLTCVFALWLAGHSLEYAAPIVDSNAAGWVRLSSLVALPVFAGLVYRYALRVPPPREPGLPAQLIRALATLGRAGPGGEVDNGLRLTAPALARALDADVIALAALGPNGDDHLRVVALHPPKVTVRRSQDVTIPLQDTPALRAALGFVPAEPAPQSAPAGPADAALDVEAGPRLFRNLGFDSSGPLLVCPLGHGGGVVGAILAGNPTSRRPWEERDRQVLDAIGPAIAAAIAPAQERQDRDLGAELRTASARNRELSGRVAELEEQLTEERGRFAAMAAGRNQYRQMAEQLAAKLRQYEGREPGAGESSAAVSEAVDVGPIVAAVAHSLSAELAKRELTLHQDVPIGLPPADVDRGLVLRIIANALYAASAAATDGTEVVMRARRVAADDEGELPPDSLLLSVGYKDRGSGQGTGLPEGLAAEPPQPGASAESDAKPKASLSAARALVQDLGGLVWVESGVGPRTTFSFTLPVAARSGQAQRDPEAQPPE